MMNSNFTDKDIICAQGKFADLHPGNVMFRKLVNAHKQTYAHAPNSDKRKISRGIVAALRRFGFNFLKFDTDTGCYDDIGDKKAVAKTSQALREKRNNNGYSNSSSYITSSDTSSEESCFNYSIQLLQSLSEEEPVSQPSNSNRTLYEVLKELGVSHESFLLSNSERDFSEMSLSVEPIPLTDEQATDRFSSTSLDDNGNVEAV
jgi:hypothetical protein